MRCIFFYTIFLYTTFAYSQANTNILPDGGFETYTGTCYVGPQENIDSSVYWRNGNEGSADYFGTCYNQTNGWVHFYPNVVGGNQYPKTGAAFAGIFATSYPTRNYDYREYLQTHLLIPLEAGKKYYAGCYMNLGENYKRYSTNNIGLLLSSSKPDYDSVYFSGQWYQNGPINEVPQVMNDTTFNLNDTLGWVLVADTFVAQGGEQWLTIGNFRDDAHSIIAPTGYTTNVNDSASYYFVDDAFVYCIDTACAIVPTIGLKETKTKSVNFNLYPNPTSGNLTVEFDAIKSGENATISVYALDGKLVIKADLAVYANTTKLSVKDLQNGVYIVKLTKNGVVLTNERLVIVK